MAYWNQYFTPGSVKEAVDILTRFGGNAMVIGGGTDLLLEIQQGHRPPVEALVDSTLIEGLDSIEEKDGYIVIGAGIKHAQIVADPRVQARGTCLAESCGVIGGPQVRNVGTLAGNVAHALPAGDGAISMLALGGEVEVADGAGTTWMPMANTFIGPGKSSIDSSRALLTRLRFKPTGKNEGSAFRRIMRPQGVALPIIGIAVRVAVDGAAIASARVAIGPAGPTPFLAEKTMAFLAGKPAREATCRDAVNTALNEARLRTSRHRASAEYRVEMIKSELPRTLMTAIERSVDSKER